MASLPAYGDLRYHVPVKVSDGRNGCAKVVKVSQLRAVGGAVRYCRRPLDASVSLHEHYEHPAPGRPPSLVVVMPGPGSDVRDAVPVKVAHACHGGAEVVVVAQGGAVCTVAFYDRGSLYAAVMIHEHHVHGAPVVPSGVVPGRAGSDVRDAVPVKVVYACHGGAEVVTVGQVGTVGGVVVYLHGARYPAVIVHEKQVHGAPVFPPGVVPGRAGSYVDYAVSIQVPYLLHVPSHPVALLERGCVPHVVAYLQRALEGVVCVGKHQVQRAPVVPSGVVPGGTGYYLRRAVHVKVAQDRHRRAEFVVCMQGGTVGGGFVYHDCALCSPVIIQEEVVQRPLPAVRPGGAYHYVRAAAAVDVSHSLHRTSKGSCASKRRDVVRVLVKPHARLGSAVCVEHQDVYRARIARGAHCDVSKAVPIDVSDAGYVRAELAVLYVIRAICGVLVYGDDV